MLKNRVQKIVQLDEANDRSLMSTQPVCTFTPAANPVHQDVEQPPEACTTTTQPQETIQVNRTPTPSPTQVDPMSQQPGPTSSTEPDVAFNIQETQSTDDRIEADSSIPMIPPELDTILTEMETHLDHTIQQ